jgi:protein-tyrosine-phosphatase
MTRSPDAPVKILFICVGNACRSQMAEAWATHFGKDWVQASSAGSNPFGSIVKGTCDAMKEKGISLDGQWSKGLPEVAVSGMDVVVTMGAEVECPLPADFKGRFVEWQIPDPYGRSMDSFRNVRDMIERQVLSLLADVLVLDVPAQQK